MSNISFDNPFLLIIGVVLLISLFISFFLCIKRGSFNFHNIASLVIHAVIIVLVTLSMARMKLEMVVTETNVYVMADVSYSSKNNLDNIDTYIKRLNKNLPKNSKLGIVTFAKEPELLVKLGGKIVSVKKSKVDNSETNILDALNYTASLFKNDVIKRIVVISDGYDTNNEILSGVSEDLGSKDIYIDAIYLNNNILEGTPELQVSNVVYGEKSYKNKDSNIEVSIEANIASKAKIELYKNDVLYSDTVESLNEGLNIISLKTDTTTPGDFRYKVVVSEFVEDGNKYDTSIYNNIYLFKQEVVDTVKVLFISELTKDMNEFENIYSSEEYEVTYFVNDKEVPYRLEELCEYDEIVISNTNVSKLNNADAFVSNLEVAVSEFGKSLTTIGNTYIQNDEKNETLKEFGSILPVKFDNNENNKKLYTLILDISKSMNQVSHFIMAKDAACSIIDMLDENHDLLVIGFYGDVEVVYNINQMTPSNKEAAKAEINALVPKQATNISVGLERAYSLVSKLTYSKKEAMLISDGRTYSLDTDNAAAAATKLSEANVHVNVIYTANTEGEAASSLLQTIANNGKGNYYQVYDEESAKNLVLTQIADEITENHKSGDNYSVSITKPKDELVAGILSKPEDIKEFYTCVLKPTAQSILEVTEKNKTYPLYSTWSYGNGYVSSFATSISSELTSSWREEGSVGIKILSNIVNANMPDVQIYSPFIFDIQVSGNKTNITISAPTVSDSSKIELKVLSPTNKEDNYVMAFDSMNHICTIDTKEVGTYIITLSYMDGNVLFETTKSFTISYQPEYNEFKEYNPSDLYSIINNNGTVSEDGNLEITNDGLDVILFNYDFMPLFMLISVILFVIDVAVRKLRWQDIASLFKKTKKGVMKK